MMERHANSRACMIRFFNRTLEARLTATIDCRLCETRNVKSCRRAMLEQGVWVVHVAVYLCEALSVPHCEK